MDKGTEGPIIERRFGNTLIMWKITSFCFKTCKEDFLIHSPKFFVDGLYLTKWRMTLNTKSKQYGENCFVLSLERTASDTASEHVYVDLKISIMSEEGKEYSMTYASKFRKNDPHKIPIWRIVDMLKILNPSSFHYGSLCFWFHMIVDFDDDCTGVSEVNENELKVLSDDLINLYKVGSNYDIILKLNNNDIYAHKAILCSRSKVLTNIIENDCVEMMVDMKNFGYETMHNLIEYFYSGNIDYIAKRPSIEMYEHIVVFDIPDLKELYNVHSLEMVSEMEVQDHTFLWTVSDFKKITGDCIFSPVFTNDYLDAAWRVSVRENSMNYIAIHADVIRGSIPRRGFVEFSLVNNDNILWTKTFQLPDQDKYRVGDEHFIKRKSLDCILDKVGSNSLDLAFTVRLHKGTASSRVKYSLGRAPVPVDKFYRILSVFLSYVYEVGKYVDFTFEVEGQLFRVHKCILSARSHVFASMFKDAK